ncbi:FadR/GntR family transcriptional regulator [Actinacidiphila soli]|uniref:FadR/GntR family transcriptional regulator n=1 Tax=Actinacidiphila soli TaxID=2487275 RepID=UPI0013E3016B|nr:GntR family transcriptional regulator [Actinacidiphila soli]
MTDDVNRAQEFHRFERGRVADRIFEDLRNQILRGALPDGSRLPAERDLADQYGVSGATVREAVRALTAMGLVSVRHGSGSFVTASADAMIAVSIASVIQLKDVGAAEVLGLLGVLNAHAVELAARNASDEEIASLRAAAEKLVVIDSVDRAAADLKQYLRRLSEISHSALLAALCRFFADVQVELAFAMSGGPKLVDWKRIAGALHPQRIAVVEALEVRDGARAAEMVRTYHARALELVTSSPRTEEIKVADPLYSQLIASLVNTRLADQTQ